MSETITRERRITWTDPAALAAEAPGSAGLDFIGKIVRGELPPPPIADLMEMRIVSAEPGSVVFTMAPAEYMFNPIGSVHGGAITTILDSAIGCAVQTTLPRGTVYTTIDIQVRFVRAVTLASGTLTAIGTVTHSGRRLAVGEAVLRDADGRICATATSSCMVVGAA
ncbi:MAG TPA: PaaI family thioesterase [Candidatus Baltobacteraceae bacterium]|nr:PaaI family thioesterase [Candidatus Baltobacteraceae bacterium]